MSVHPSPSPSRASSYSNPPANGSSMAGPPPSQPSPFVPPPGPAPPPPSLREILGQFSEHGGGDRELLLSILSAKTAEEDRIASQMAYNSLLFSLSNSYPSLQPSFGAPPSPAPSSASIPPVPAQHASSSTLVPFSLASPSSSNQPQPSSSNPPRPTLNGSRSPSYNSSSTLPHPPPPTITTTAAPSSSPPPPPSSSHQLHPASLSPNLTTSSTTLPQLPPFVRRGSSTGSANGTVRKLGLLDLLGGSGEASSSGSGSGNGIEREESFVRGSPTSGRLGVAEGEGSRAVGTGTQKRNADDGEEEMEVDELDED